MTLQCDARDETRGADFIISLLGGSFDSSVVVGLQVEDLMMIDEELSAGHAS